MRLGYGLKNCNQTHSLTIKHLFVEVFGTTPHDQKPLFNMTGLPVGPII